MSIDLIAELYDMFEAGALIADPGSEDYAGNWVASGAQQVIDAYVSGGTKLVRSPRGEEVVSSVQVITAGYFNLDTDHYRYTIPSRFNPNTDLRAVGVEHYTDEGGVPAFQQVFFP